MEKKVMSDYSCFCTPEQTKKALELGAPIEYQLKGTFKVPTAEQLIGFLEEQGLQFNCHSNYLNEWEFDIYTTGRRSQLIGGSGWCGNKKQATLVAIDAALEYLTDNKK